MSGIKQGARILAIASGPTSIGGKRRGRVILIGIVSRGKVVEGVISTKVSVDGNDATRRIIGMVEGSRFAEQIRIIALNGIAVAGLNVVDFKTLMERLGVEVAVITRDRPSPSGMKRALLALHKKENVDVKERIAVITQLKGLGGQNLRGFYVQSGMGDKDIKGRIGVLIESLRLAHLVARGVETGESKGRM